MARAQLILDRYQPLAEAGTGGFGTVQVAWDTRIERKVAIKCIELGDPVPAGNHGAAAGRRGSPGDRDETQMSADPSEQEALEAQTTVSLGGIDDAKTRALGRRDGFSAAVRAYLKVPGLDEARTAALLNDANIVAVYDFEVQGSTAYLIMEYVEGLTLTQLLKEHGDALTLDGVAAVFSAVAHALDEAHEEMVLHLDIKPDNILIDRKGQVKVTDFGLAKLAGAGGFGAAGGGTIGYMPLEQMRGELLDVRCDEWALASVTYEMLVGENPFLADSLPKAEAAIEDAELVLPSLCWDDLDEQADDVLFYALDPDREERYDTVADFAEEMEKFLGDARRGRRELAALVNADEESQEDAPSQERPAHSRERLPLDERIGPRARIVAGRVAAVAGSALVAGLGLSNLPGASGADNPVFWGLLAVVCVAAAIVPHAGALAAFAVLSAALIAQGSPAAGCLLVAAAGVWWWFVGRRGVAPANSLLAGPLAGAVGAAAFAPFAAGAALRPLQALATAALSAFGALALASLGSGSLFGWDAFSTWWFSDDDIQGRLIRIVLQPGTWAVMAGWIASAAALSLFRLRGTRAFDAAGTVVAAAALAAADCAAHGLSSHLVSWTPDPAHLASILLVAAVVAVVACAFPRNEEPPSDDTDEGSWE